MLFFRKGRWQGYGLVAGFDGRGIRLCSLLIVLLLEQLLQVFLDGLPHLDRKTSGQRIKGGIGIYSGSIDVEFFPPDQFFLLTLFKNGIKKRLHLGTTVTCPTYRYPSAIVAQAFATLSLFAPGRVFLGVGGSYVSCG